MFARLLWTLRVAFPLGGLFAVAGGLGLAATAGLATLVSLPPRALYQVVRNPSPALIASGLALGWLVLSFAWSPYDRPDQAIKLALLTPLFLALPFIAHRAPEEIRVRLRPVVIVSAILALLMITFEGLAGAPVTISYKIGVEGYASDRQDLLTLANRMLGRGALFVEILAIPAIILLWRAGTRPLRVAAIAMGVLALVAASTLATDANLVSALMAVALAASAWRWPVRTLQAGLVVVAVVLVTAPFLFGVCLRLVPDTMRESLPFSWAWRVEIWDFVVGLIGEKPVFGHGLDSARAITATQPMRGFDVDLLPLHAHNAALSIWLDTGFVGALLIAATLVLTAREIGRRGPRRELCVMAAAMVSYWLTSVMLGFGLWQEWHHGALSLALAAAMIAAPGPTVAGELRD